ncbi:CocE/NonD family hydrolase [Sphingomonas sp. ASY06-1R]|uniref:CocE/NonD family hydrolase n=1 Tax=Sphingomonas sp. ASY06-1R TaxID=3445771 RepID=UPI003FA1CDE4
MRVKRERTATGGVRGAALLALIAILPANAMSAPAVPYRDYVATSHYVKVRDGTRLAVSVYRPAVDHKAVVTPYPVIFVFTPYRARYRDDKGQIVETGLSTQLGLKGLTDHGYVVAVADIRGKGASFGHRRGFQDRTEALDGRDLIQWLAKQPWSTGKVGMVGCSYLGGATLQVASTAPPALKAIFTGASDLDKYDFVRRGGITAQFNTRPDEPASVDLATIPVDEDRDGSMLKAAVAEHAANTPMAPLWYGMPYRDSVSPLTGNRFWEEVGPYTYLDTIRRAGIATYFWGNWQDEPTQQVIALAANLNGKLLLGPGSHCVPPPNYDLSGEVRRYFDYHLKGIDNGIQREPRVTMWVVNAPAGQEWHRTNALPGISVQRTPFYLDDRRSGSAASINDGTLAARPAGQGRDSFQVDYDVGSADYFAFWVDPMDKHGLTYTTAPLPADRILVGSPILTVKLAADRSDVNLFGYLEDVAPDGKAEVVAFGRLAASHRKEAKPPYDTLGLPWHSGRQADVAPITPGAPVILRFAFTPTARRIPVGHRLRLALAGADHRQRNLAQIKVDPAPRITIVRGSASHIDIPLVAPNALP